MNITIPHDEIEVVQTEPAMQTDDVNCGAIIAQSVNRETNINNCSAVNRETIMSTQSVNTSINIVVEKQHELEKSLENSTSESNALKKSEPTCIEVFVGSIFAYCSTLVIASIIVGLMITGLSYFNEQSFACYLFDIEKQDIKFRHTFLMGLIIVAPLSSLFLLLLWNPAYIAIVNFVQAFHDSDAKLIHLSCSQGFVLAIITIALSIGLSFLFGSIGLGIDILTESTWQYSKIGLIFVCGIPLHAVFVCLVVLCFTGCRGLSQFQLPCLNSSSGSCGSCNCIGGAGEICAVLIFLFLAILCNIYAFMSIYIFVMHCVHLSYRKCLSVLYYQ